MVEKITHETCWKTKERDITGVKNEFTITKQKFNQNGSTQKQKARLECGTRFFLNLKCHVLTT